MRWWRGPSVSRTRQSIENSELIFAGYGVTAPEFDWDDFKDVDVKGKTILVLVNDPQMPDRADPSQLDTALFNGKAMTYYGRWTYKFEEGARRGAAGILIVHETGPAGYPFAVVQGNLGERFDLVTPDKNMGRASIEGWLSLDAAKKLLAHGRSGFRRAQEAGAHPRVPSGAARTAGVAGASATRCGRFSRETCSRSSRAATRSCATSTSSTRRTGIISARARPWMATTSTTARSTTRPVWRQLLEIARAFTSVEPRPKRSVLFLMVGAEEQGLLGSQHYAEQPIYPLAKTLASINIDGVNQWGRTKDITVIGMGASDLDDYLRDAAAQQGRVLRPDPESEKGFYYRSDHFNFAKKGVPALYTDTGIDFVGKPAEYSQQKRDEYTNKDYHAPSDEIKPDWDLTGADRRRATAVSRRLPGGECRRSSRSGSRATSSRRRATRCYANRRALSQLPTRT